MGVLPDGLRLFERLSGGELLDYLGRLRGIPAEVVDQRATELLAVLDLTEAGAEARRRLLDGHAQEDHPGRGAAAHAAGAAARRAAGSCGPGVSARVIRRVLTRYTENGGTVIFSSHVMALVEELCSHVAVMGRGRIIASGDLAQVRGQAASLDDAFMHLVGAEDSGSGGLEWLRSSQA